MPPHHLTLPVVLELGGHLRNLAGAADAAMVAEHLSSDLRILLRQLGLPGEPVVEIRGGESSRAVRIRVQGRILPFPPELMTELWKSAQPEGLQRLAEAVSQGPSPFPDGWLQSYVEALREEADVEPRRVLTFLGRLAFEIIRERPACLMGLAQAQAYAEEAAEAEVASVAPQIAERLLAVLRALLDLGVTVTNRATIMSAIAEGVACNRSIEDDIEAAFSHLRAPRIEVHIHPGHLREIIPEAGLSAALSALAGIIPEDRQEPFRLLRRALFYASGLHLPEVLWVPSLRMPSGSFALKINDRVGLPVRGLGPEELFVAADTETLATRGIARLRAAINPANSETAIIVPKAAQEALEAGGFFTLDALGLVVLTLAAEIRRKADRLFSCADAEFHLALVEESYPDLVRIVLDRFSIGEVTRVLRGLLGERLTIRDMRTILERLLQFDTIRVDSSRLVTFDDRLPVTEELPPGKSHSEAYREFVRQGMKLYLTHRAGGDEEALSVIGLDYELQHRAAQAAESFSETEEEAIRDALWTAIGKLPTGVAQPVVLTNCAARSKIRCCLVPEFPGLAVLSDAELQPKVTHYVARIPAPQSQAPRLLVPTGGA